MPGNPIPTLTLPLKGREVLYNNFDDLMEYFQVKKETAAAEETSNLTDTERAVARELQGDIPTVERPFQQIADKIGITENEVLTAAASLIRSGAIRKIGAILRHRQAGFTHNIMVAWAIPSNQVEEIGRLFSTFSEVTHCYERSPSFLNRYNLFTMVHLHGKEDESLLKMMSGQSGISDFVALPSVEEFKKKSMEYF